MKNLLLLFGILCCANWTFAQYNHKDLVGTYEGYQYLTGSGKDMSSKWKFSISSTYDISIWMQTGDIWIEQATLTTSPNEIEQKNGNVYYSFTIKSPSQYKDLSIGLMSEWMKKRGKIDGLYFMLIYTDGKFLSWDMNKEGGNPSQISKPTAATSQNKLAPETSSSISRITNNLAAIIKLQDTFISIQDKVNELATSGASSKEYIKQHDELKAPLNTCIRAMHSVQNDFVVLQKEARLRKCNSAYAIFQDAYDKSKALKKKLNDIDYSLGLLQTAKTDKEINYYAKEGIWERLNSFRIDLQLLAKVAVDISNIYADCPQSISSTSPSTSPLSSSSSSSSSSTINTQPPSSTPNANQTSSVPSNTISDVGLVITEMNGEYRVAEVKPGWAADKAGIKKGMAVTYINGFYLNTNGMTEEKIETMMQGRIGESLKIRFGEEVSFVAYKDYELYRGQNGKAKLLYDSAQPKRNGIGIKVKQYNKGEAYTVVLLPRNSAAYLQGVRHFDKILRIDNVDITHNEHEEVIELLKGEKGSAVNLTIERGGEEMEIKVVR